MAPLRWPCAEPERTRAAGLRSPVVRAPACQAGGRGFESRRNRQWIAQSGRASDLESESRGFDSRSNRPVTSDCNNTGTSSRVPSGRIPAAGRVVPARAGPRDPSRHPQRPAGGVPSSPRPSRRCEDCAAAHADGPVALPAGPALPRSPATTAAAPTFGCGMRPTLRYTTRRAASRAQDPRGWSARRQSRRGLSAARNKEQCHVRNQASGHRPVPAWPRVS